MTLAELLEELPNLDDELTIYTSADADWSCNSPVVAIYEPSDGTLPPEATAMQYLLEVGIAKVVLKVWSQWRGGREPSPQEKCEAVIYYAKNDAYLPL
jgi:hypothetical protein